MTRVETRSLYAKRVTHRMDSLSRLTSTCLRSSGGSNVRIFLRPDRHCDRSLPVNLSSAPIFHMVEASHGTRPYRRRVDCLRSAGSAAAGHLGLSRGRRIVRRLRMLGGVRTPVDVDGLYDVVDTGDLCHPARRSDSGLRQNLRRCLAQFAGPFFE